MGKFKIEADDLGWLGNLADDTEDLCLHGHAVVYIGDAVLEYDATVSATALYLLKTLTENHIIYEENQMLPCCGFTLIANDDLTNVDICGCPNGVDWSVIHEGDTVKLILENGTETRVSIDEYKKEVCRFADMIEAFYDSSKPKKMPQDEFDKNGYIAFWNEWHRRRKAERGRWL